MLRDQPQSCLHSPILPQRWRGSFGQRRASKWGERKQAHFHAQLVCPTYPADCLLLRLSEPHDQVDCSVSRELACGLLDEAEQFVASIRKYLDESTGLQESHHKE